MKQALEKLALPLSLALFFLFGCSVRGGNSGTNFPISNSPSGFSGQNAFFVATDGSDSSDGLQPVTTGSSGPFATINQGLLAAANLRARQVTTGTLTPITVYVRAGTYYLPNPLSITDSLSGTSNSPFTLTNFPGESPVVSGGRLVIGFTLFDPVNNIWRAQYPDASINLSGQLHNLWANGSYAVKARYPKNSQMFAHPEYQNQNFWIYTTTNNLTAADSHGNPIPAQDGSTHIPVPASTWATLGGWDFSNAEISPYDAYGYSMRTFAVSGLDSPNQNILFANPYNNFPVAQGNRFYVSNILSELSDPNEWFLDKANRLIYFKPPSGAATSLTVEVSGLSSLINIRGSSNSNPANFITISGLTFHGTSDTFANSNPSYKDGAAINMSQAQNVTIKNVWIQNTSGSAINIGAYSSNISVSHSVFSGIGGAGLVAYGHPYYGTPPVDLFVFSNFFSRSGLLMNMPAIYLDGASDSSVSGNQIERTNGSAIGQAGDDADGFVTTNNRILGNETYLSVLNSADLGSIYVAGNSANGERVFIDSVIQGNRLRAPMGSNSRSDGILLAPNGASGIYLDNYASGNYIADNIVAGASHANFKINNGSSNTFYRNLATNVTSAVDDSNTQVEMYTFIGSTTDPNYFSGNTFSNNAFALLGPSDVAPFFQFPDFAGPDQSLTSSTGNLFWRSTTTNLATYPNFYQTSGTTQKTFTNWLASPRDTNSVLAQTNPGFFLPSDGVTGLGVIGFSYLDNSLIGPSASLLTGLRYEFGPSDPCLGTVIGPQFAPIDLADPSLVYACLKNKP